MGGFGIQEDLVLPLNHWWSLQALCKRLHTLNAYYINNIPLINFGGIEELNVLKCQ